ncbi:hypothetical protein MVES1_003192 [Malassezia vespertilionis]|uniref:Magnesium transporter NIPA-domain-containing protein n=1 Tax=Malassezia vespertilionis TaxID=2020962 RepID=A0A2N1J9U4_9BASI|nr:uncharacterized protein MVES1_003192 [Malassezia vespertilionis]PKI83329.1 hypothetical protein MVES_003032 [Malassezia vespertilionis]WFD07821.1 hypothetical protein MVES1_003192 [Malassezia vespertilionis]
MGMSQWWIGIGVTVASNVVISLALNCQKLAHMRLDAEAVGPDSEHTALLRARTTRVSYLQSKLWWLGLALMCVGETGNFFSYGFAPASLIAPLGAVALLANVLIAPALLHEKTLCKDIVGICFATLGAVTVVSSAAPQTSVPLRPSSLWVAMARPVFVAYAVLAICGALALIWFSRTESGKPSVIAHVGVCALFGGFTVLATKGVSSFLVLGARAGHRAWVLYEPLFYMLVAVMLVSAVAQLLFLNKALQRFGSQQVIPTMFVLFTISTIVGSAVLYRDFERMSWGHVVLFATGCALTFLGVFVLTSEHALDDDDVEAPHEPHATGHAPLQTAASLPNAMRPLRQSSLANIAAALVEHSQQYLHGPSVPHLIHPNQRGLHRSTSLTDLREDAHGLRQQHTMLGLSPGLHLFLGNTHPLDAAQMVSRTP